MGQTCVGARNCSSIPGVFLTSTEDSWTDRKPVSSNFEVKQRLSMGMCGMGIENESGVGLIPTINEDDIRFEDDVYDSTTEALAYSIYKDLRNTYAEQTSGGMLPLRFAWFLMWLLSALHGASLLCVLLFP